LTGIWWEKGKGRRAKGEWRKEKGERIREQKPEN
jgi:hypothetical protein